MHSQNENNDSHLVQVMFLKAVCCKAAYKFKTSTLKLP